MKKAIIGMLIFNCTNQTTSYLFLNNLKDENMPKYLDIRTTTL